MNYLVLFLVEVVLAAYLDPSMVHKLVNLHSREDPIAFRNPTLNNGPLFKTLANLTSSNWFNSPIPQQGVLAYVEETNSFYQPALAEPQRVRRNILIEIQFGESQRLMLSNPISNVFSSENGGTASISKSNSFSQLIASLSALRLEINWSANPSNIISNVLNQIQNLGMLVSGVSMALGNALGSGVSAVLEGAVSGINTIVQTGTSLLNGAQFLNTNIGYKAHGEVDDATSNTRLFSGSTSCSAPVNGSVQMFADIALLSNPNVRARYVSFDDTTSEIIPLGEFSPVTSSDQYPELGMIVFDNSRGIAYSCVTDPKFFVEDPRRILAIDNPNINIVDYINENRDIIS